MLVHVFEKGSSCVKNRVRILSKNADIIQKSIWHKQCLYVSEKCLRPFKTIYNVKQCSYNSKKNLCHSKNASEI